jgi:hypothetical protein
LLEILFVRLCLTTAAFVTGMGLSLTLWMERPVFAVLGASTTTVEQDRQRLKATVKRQSRTGYTVHALEARDGSVREYASPAGIIYGLAWNHQTGLLDLEELFGAYYAEYTQAVTDHPQPRRRARRITTEHLVVERGGRMGAVWGRVWVLPLLPSGLSEAHIQ